MNYFAVCLARSPLGRPDENRTDDLSCGGHGAQINLLSAFRIKMEATVQTVQASESKAKLTTEAVPTSQAAYAKKN